MIRWASYTEIIESTGGVWVALDREAALVLFREEVERAVAIAEDGYDFSVTLWEVEVPDDQLEELAEDLADAFWLELPTRGEPPREVEFPNGTARLIRRAWKYKREEATA